MVISPANAQNDQNKSQAKPGDFFSPCVEFPDFQDAILKILLKNHLPFAWIFHAAICGDIVHQRSIFASFDAFPVLAAPEIVPVDAVDAPACATRQSPSVRALCAGTSPPRRRR